MKIYEIVFSPTGGTKKVSELLMSEFEGEKEVIDLLSEETDFRSFKFHKEDLCVVAVPSFGGRVPKTAVKRIGELKGNGANVVLVCAYGNRDYEDTLLELKNVVQQAGFHAAAAVTAIAEHSIMRQYGAGRPDESDKKILRQQAKEIWDKFTHSDSLPEVSVPGNETYREYGGVPFKPEANKKCNECGICAKECPVGAIAPDNLKGTDKNKCISCMRCIAVCPQKARGLNKIVLAVAAKKMKKAFETRKEGELFLG